jgi:hypothetical protein
MSIRPRGQVERNNQAKQAYARLGEPQIEIAAWCPDEKAEQPPEQVHFIMHWPVGMDLPPMAIRFKSPDTLGFFVEELIKYRRIVWPTCQAVAGEGKITLTRRKRHHGHG